MIEAYILFSLIMATACFATFHETEDFTRLVYDKEQEKHFEIVYDDIGTWTVVYFILVLTWPLFLLLKAYKLWKKG